jgi:hypothetical protein|tara:strand:+ start:4020 stop:4265 length:246 start_codon:yes stop_codon:yes gene_type:complete
MKVVTADDILAKAVATKRKTKLEVWLTDNPAEAKVYLEVMKRGLAEGRAFQHLHFAARQALGGPDISPQVAKPLVMVLIDE